MSCKGRNMPGRPRKARGGGCMPQMPLSRLGLMPPRSRSQIMKDARMTRIQAKLLRKGTGKGQEATLTKNFVAARIITPNTSQSGWSASLLKCEVVRPKHVSKLLEMF